MTVASKEKQNDGHLDTRRQLKQKVGQVMTRRATAVLAAVAAVALMLSALVGAGTAQAKWRETPRVGVMGEEIWTVGSGGTCRGSMHVSLKNDARKPGRIQLTVRSKGFTRDKCRATLKFVFHNTRAPFDHQRYFRVEGTKKRGTVLAKKEYWIGSGFDLVSVTSTASPSKGISYYIAIP